MLYIDSKYITIVGSQLRNFKRKNTNLYNCSCPLCGDSIKKKTKARGYFYEYNNCAFYKCHNCHASMSFEFFLKTYSAALHDSYSLEKFSDSSAAHKPKNILDSKPNLFVASSTSDELDAAATKICNLPDEHYAKSYIINRQLPKIAHENLYFTQDFKQLVLKLFPNTTSNLYDGDARIVIPFYSKTKKLIGLQGRSLTANTTLRYITIKSDNEGSLLFGLDRYDFSKPGYVVEGPIDSLFIPNCLATANSNLESVCSKISSDLILIYDNEPKNKEIVKLIEASINHNRRVCIWPKTVNYKDINDMVLSGMSASVILDIINAHTFSGLSAMLEFNQWKRV